MEIKMATNNSSGINLEDLELLKKSEFYIGQTKIFDTVYLQDNNRWIFWNVNPKYNSHYHFIKSVKFVDSIAKDPERVTNKTLMPGISISGEQFFCSNLEKLCKDSMILLGKNSGLKFRSCSLANRYAGVVLGTKYPAINDEEWGPKNGRISVVANKLYRPLIKFMAETSEPLSTMPLGLIHTALEKSFSLKYERDLRL